MLTAPSLLDHINKDRSFTSGFDYLRIGLSIAVTIVHCVGLSTEDPASLLWGSWLTPLIAAVLPAFFSLSGYLVSGSLLRNSIPMFAGLRALRIVPALAFEVVLSAIVLGVLFTKLSYYEYFSSPEFATYFLNIVGYIQFTLPGVFEGRMVNAQLWTIPAELECYIALMLAAATGLFARRLTYFAFVTLACITFAMLSVRFDTIAANGPFTGRVLVFGFLFGTVIFQFRDRLPYSAPLAALSFAIALLIFQFPNISYVGTLPLSYSVVYVGLMRLPKIPFGDLSYGLYLFHFPVARAFQEASGQSLSWWALTPMTLVASALLAQVSWKWIEEPLLQRKVAILRAVGAPFRMVSPLKRA